jgi:hypothetical protein
MRNVSHIAVSILLGSAAVACSEEPTIPRGGGGPPGGAPAPAAAAPGAAAPGAATPGGAGAGTAADVTDGASLDVPDIAPAAEPADATDPSAEVSEAPDVADPADTADVPSAPDRPRRLNTSSEMLGLGADRATDSATALPYFLKDRPAGAGELLFAGKPSEPSAAYAGLAGEVLPVSPIDRLWGSNTEESADEIRRRELLQQSMGEAKNPIFAPDAPLGEVPPDGGTVDPDATMVLEMYKLGPNGELQTYERRFASKEAREAGERYARGLGFKPERPSAEEIDALKGKVEAQKKAEADKKAGGAEDPCAFKASWQEGSVQKQSCFPTQAALDAFTKARAAAPKTAAPGTPARPGTAPAAPAGGTPAPAAPVAPPPAPIGDLQPVKVGQ